MTYANRVCHDADSHIMETREWLAPFVEQELKGRIKNSNRQVFQMADKIIAKALLRRTDVEADRQAAENPISGPKGWAAYGAFDTAERSRALDNLGFSSQLVFPTFSLAPLLLTEDEDILYGGVRAHNRAMGAFCSPDKRLLGVAYIPLDNPARAADEVDIAVEAGCRAIQVSAGPAGERSPGHIDFDPFWRKLVERKLPFMLHIGPGTKLQPKKFQNNGRERAPDFHGGGENLRFGDYMTLAFAPQMFLTAMVYDGVFERFPALRGGVIESGAGWVPEFLRQLDFAHKSFVRTDPYLKEMSLKPSEYVRRAVRFTPIPGENVGLMIREAGPELFLFSSDYPHPEGSPDPITRFERKMEGIDEDAKEQFYRTNFEDMMML